ncbi:hypothetical protein QL285_040170 [Trifolium repens]|nr:hypothetical protein QL285_040170 [Trifolium repens]
MTGQKSLLRCLLTANDRDEGFELVIIVPVIVGEHLVNRSFHTLELTFKSRWKAGLQGSGPPCFVNQGSTQHMQRQLHSSKGLDFDIELLIRDGERSSTWFLVSF